MGADGLREESSFMIASNRNHQKSPARLSTTPASYFSSDNEEQLNQKTGPSVVSPLGVEIDPSTSCIQKSTPSSAKSMRLDFSHMRVGNDSASEEFLGFAVLLLPLIVITGNMLMLLEILTLRQLYHQDLIHLPMALRRHRAVLLFVGIFLQKSRIRSQQ